MTDLALIPPHAFQMDSVWEGATYLFLPQFFKDSNYGYYVRQARKTAMWTILDNGAFEGAETSITDLMQLAKKNNIHEVVLPDVMGNKTMTLDALKQTAAVLPRVQWGQRRYMFVVQGTSFKECCDCIKIASAHMFPFTTFALPKHLLRTVAAYGDKNAKTIRLRLARFIRKLYGDRYNIHFLGASPVWIGEGRHLRDLNVRSMDTSMPYVYAANGWSLLKAASADIVFERQEHYFGIKEGNINADLLADNINYMIRMVHG